MELAELPVNEDWITEDWKMCFAATAEDTSGVEHRTATVPSHPVMQAIEPRRIAEVVRFRGESPEGWSSVLLYAVVRLHDGLWASLEAWADTSGWGCRDGVTWHIGNTQEDVERWGLDDEGRRALGIDHPS